MVYLSQEKRLNKCFKTDINTVELLMGMNFYDCQRSFPIFSYYFMTEKNVVLLKTQSGIRRG